MSDGVIPVSTDASDLKGHSQLHSAGSMLRKAREASGLHVAALAVSMKVPVKKLEALEADRLDLLPDMVFVRALASSVCRTLKIDPMPVLEKLPNTNKPKLISAERDINTPFDAYGSSASLSLSSVFKKPVVGVVLFLLLAAGVVFFLPEFQSRGSSEDVVIAPAQVFPESAPAVTPASSDGSIPLAKTVGAQEGLSSSSGLPPVEASAPDIAQTPLPAASATATTGSSASANLLVPPANKAVEAGVAKVSVSDTLTLKATAPCWVKVVDANGVVHVLRVVAAGETIGVGGASPLSVVIGAVDAMTVEVRGKPFNLMAVAKDNVARFEVK